MKNANVGMWRLEKGALMWGGFYIHQATDASLHDLHALIDEALGEKHFEGTSDPVDAARHMDSEIFAPLRDLASRVAALEAHEYHVVIDRCMKAVDARLKKLEFDPRGLTTP